MNKLQDSLKRDVLSDKAALDKVINELEALKTLTRTCPNEGSRIVENINRLENELRSLIKEFDKYKMPPVHAELTGKHG